MTDTTVVQEPVEDAQPAEQPELKPEERQGGKVEFTDEQQAVINRIVAKEVAAERRRIEAKAQQDRERQEAEARGEYAKVLAEIERERDEAVAILRRANAERAVELAARKAQAEHPEVVVKLIRDELQYDEQGNPLNVEVLIAALKKDYPRYFAAPAAGADGGKSGASTPPTDMDSMIRKAVKR